MRTILVLVLTMAPVLGGFAAAADEQDRIVEAVFRQQLSFWLDENGRASATVVCLAVEENGEERSVSKDYLRRFSGEKSVRRSADCEARESGAVERKTGRPAVIVRAGKVHRENDGEAWVTIHYYRSGLASGPQTHRVVRTQTGWSCLGPILKGAPA